MSILFEVKPPTGEPCAGNPPARFGGRGGLTGPPYPYRAPAQAGVIRFPPSVILKIVKPASVAPEPSVTPPRTVICPPLGNVSLPVKMIVASSSAGLYETVNFVIDGEHFRSSFLLTSLTLVLSTS